MALRFVDGFDSYVTTDLLKKWNSSSGTVTISAGNGRRSTASYRIAGGSRWIQYSQEAQDTWIIGSAVRYTTAPSGAAYIYYWLDATNNMQCDVRINPSGTIAVTRDGTILGTSSLTLSLNVYYYIEARLVIHNTTGQAEVRVNGVAWVGPLTSQDTQATANANATHLRVGNIGTSSLGTQDFDDLYICDGTGSAPHNTFLGDCRVDTLLPNADGTSQQWTPSTPGTHYTLVDDAAPNTTDYVSSATTGHRDTYGMQDLAASTGTIYGVQLNLAAHKEDAGARLLKPLILSGASEALGASVGMPTDQLYYRHIQATDPATAAAWTESGVNAAQCGAEVA